MILSIFIFTSVTGGDSLDWKNYGVGSVINTVCNHKHLGGGSISLCHNGAKYTAQALDTMITTLLDAGYEFVPLSKLIIRENYHMNTVGRQIPDQAPGSRQTSDGRCYIYYHARRQK